MIRGVGDGTEATNSDWIELGMPAEVIPSAIAAFGDPERARKWIETLDRAPQRMVPGGFEPLWRNVSFLRELAATGMDPEDFERWRAAGLDAAAVPRWATSLRTVNVGPDGFTKWKSAGLDPRDLAEVLAHVDFEAALGLLSNWAAKRPISSAGEMLEVFRRGVTVEQLKSFLALGLRGHDVFLWHSNAIPIGDWYSWMALGVTPEVAFDYYKKGLSAEDAGPWIRAHVDAYDVTGFMKLGVGPAQAGDYVRRRVWPDLLVRTEDGIEEIDVEELKTREDLARLPEVVKPGRIEFIRQSTAAGDDYVPYDFSFRWDGGSGADWYMDISSAGGLSPASSSPSMGTLSWIDGYSLSYTYDWPEMGIHDGGVLRGEAPGDLSDPREWIRLADVLLELTCQY